MIQHHRRGSVGHTFRRAGNIALFGATVALAVLTTAACGPNSPTASSVTSGTDRIVPVAAAAPPRPASSSVATPEPTTTSGTSPASPSRFANTSATVQLVGYDDALHMIQFRKVVPIRSDDGNGNQVVKFYEPDPADPATHRLPVAADVRISLTDRECFAPHATKSSCTLDELVEAIRHFQPCAHLHVDAAGRIDQVWEEIAPIGGDAAPPAPLRAG